MSSSRRPRPTRALTAAADLGVQACARVGPVRRQRRERRGPARRRRPRLARRGDAVPRPAVDDPGRPSAARPATSRAARYGVVASAAPAAAPRCTRCYMHQNQTDVTPLRPHHGRRRPVTAAASIRRQLDFGVAPLQAARRGWLDGVSATFSVNRQGDGRFEQARPSARLDRRPAPRRRSATRGRCTSAFGVRHELVAGAEFYDESIARRASADRSDDIVTPARPDIPDGTTYSELRRLRAAHGRLCPSRLTRARRAARQRVPLRHRSRPGARRRPTEHVTTNAVDLPGAAVVQVTDGHQRHRQRDPRVPRRQRGRLRQHRPDRRRRLRDLADARRVELDASSARPAPPARSRPAKRAGGLRPEVVYQYDLGVKGRAGRVSGPITGFDLELYDFIQRRALVFDAVDRRHDDLRLHSRAAGRHRAGLHRAGRAADRHARQRRPRPHPRLRRRRRRARSPGPGRRSAYFSMANGRMLPTGDYLRRMPPPMGGAKLRWQSDAALGRGRAHVRRRADAAQQRRPDRRAHRRATARARQIATFFNGTATDLGLVQNGILVQTGETLAQVQNRVLGTANVGAALHVAGRVRGRSACAAACSSRRGST